MSPRAREEAAAALLAWQFLTRLPAPAVGFTAARMAAAPRYFPLVGALIGGLGALVLIAAAALPMAVAVLLSTAATALATGALHEDGLADTADALGAREPARALEIMRDSRIGTFGVLALGLVVGTKVAALAALPAGAAAAALVAGHAASRLSVVLVIATSRYLRAAGAGAATAGGVAPAALAAAAALGLLPLAGVALAEGPGTALAALCGLAVGHVAARLSFEPRLGGYTGDCLGATQQLGEVALYLGLVAWR